MKISLLIFGQFRNFKDNLKNNLNILKNIFFINNEIDIYLLTDKEKNGNYSDDNKNIIINIFNEYNLNNINIFYWEDLFEHHNIEKINENNYNINCLHAKGKNYFTSNLWYRRYILNNLKNKIANENKINYDLNLFVRIFDIKIDINNNCNEIIDIYNIINNNILLMSIDTIFIGTNNIMDKLFEFGKNFEIYHDDKIWKNNKLVKEFYDIDSFLVYGKYTYCSEVQIFSHIFYNIKNYKNIRVDFNNVNNLINNYSYFNVRLDPNRKKTKIK